MITENEDPFHYVLAQKIDTFHDNRNKYHNNIRLNLNKLPKDFFQKPHKTISMNSQRLKPDIYINEFLAYNKTVELKKPQKPASFSFKQD